MYFSFFCTSRPFGISVLTTQILFGLFWGLNITTQAQGNSQQLINEQVWEPFVQTYEAFDAKGFMDIHTEDVIRVSRDGNKIYSGQGYGDRMHSSFERMKASGTTRSIEFRFLQRLSQEDIAYEVGFYKITTQRPGEQARVHFGKFHVTLKKIDGQWKIAIDTDTSLNNGITEDQYMMADPL